MSADDGAVSAQDPRAGLATQLQQLESFVARAEADNEELPPEAVEMITRLREIMRALDALTASLGGVTPQASAAPPGNDAP